MQRAAIEPLVAEDPLISIWERAADGPTRLLLRRFCLALIAENVSAARAYLPEIAAIAHPWAHSTDPLQRAASMAVVAITAPLVQLDVPAVGLVAGFLEQQALMVARKG